MSVYGMFLESYEMFSLHLFSRNRIIRKEILKKHLPNKNPQKKNICSFLNKKQKKLICFVCVSCFLVGGNWQPFRDWEKMSHGKPTPFSGRFGRRGWHLRLLRIAVIHAARCGFGIEAPFTSRGILGFFFTKIHGINKNNNIEYVYIYMYMYIYVCIWFYISII